MFETLVVIFELVTRFRDCKDCGSSEMLPVTVSLSFRFSDCTGCGFETLPVIVSL